MLTGALGKGFHQIMYVHENSRIISSNVKIRYVNIPENVLKTKRDSLNAIKAVFYLIFAAFHIAERGIIVSNTYKAHFTGLVAKLRGYRWVMIERDIAEHAIERLLKRCMYRIADRTVFVSKFALSANKGRGTVINNIIEGGHSDNKVYIAYAGDFTYEKGFDRVIDIMANYRSRKYQYAVIGERPHYSNADINIPKHIKHIPYTDDIYSVFSRTAVLMLFNRKTESFSRVISESMACGAVPVVLKGNGTDDYIVDGVNGIIADNYSEKSIIDILKRLEELSVMNSISESAMETVKKFNAEHIEKQWKKLFNNL